MGLVENPTSFPKKLKSKDPTQQQSSRVKLEGLKLKLPKRSSLLRSRAPPRSSATPAKRSFAPKAAAPSPDDGLMDGFFCGGGERDPARFFGGLSHFLSGNTNLNLAFAAQNGLRREYQVQELSVRQLVVKPTPTK